MQAEKGYSFYTHFPLTSFSVLKDFRIQELREDKGKLVELVILSEIVKNLSILQEVFYWRTQSKQEVDFVIRHEDMLIPIEVKYQRFSEPEITSG